jgi:hypothetical protein
VDRHQIVEESRRSAFPQGREFPKLTVARLQIEVLTNMKPIRLALFAIFVPSCRRQDFARRRACVQLGFHRGGSEKALREVRVVEHRSSGQPPMPIQINVFAADPEHRAVALLPK